MPTLKLIFKDDVLITIALRIQVRTSYPQTRKQIHSLLLPVA
jgi:hypothetical protein